MPFTVGPVETRRGNHGELNGVSVALITDHGLPIATLHFLNATQATVAREHLIRAVIGATEMICHTAA
jgi:hypothetical protein